MRSAIDFLPHRITVLMSRSTSGSPYRWSGIISRFSAFLRLAMIPPQAPLLLLRIAAALFRALDAILAARAVAVDLVGVARAGGTERIERAAHDVISHAGQILDPAAPHED